MSKEREITDMEDGDYIILGKEAQEAMVHIMKARMKGVPSTHMLTNFTNVESKNGSKKDWVQFNIQAVFDPLLFIDEKHTYGGLILEKKVDEFMDKNQEHINKVKDFLTESNVDRKVIVAVIGMMAENCKELLDTIQK
jgi:hypothetical protein